MTESPKTLRDEFAMAALSAATSAMLLRSEPFEADRLANAAYLIADAMMAARAQAQTQEAA